MFSKTGPKERHETHTYIADHIITKHNTCLLPLVGFCQETSFALMPAECYSTLGEAAS